MSRLLREFVRKILQEEATEEDPLASIISRNPRFIVGHIPEPTQSKTIYYISSGSKGVRYTLRSKFVEWVNNRDFTVRDRHIATLGKDPVKSATKAEKLVEGEPIYYQPISLRSRAKAVPSSVIKFGKYKGQDLYDVVNIDPSYIAWLYSSIVNDPTSFLQKDAYKNFRHEVINVSEPNESVMAVAERQKEKRRREEKWKEEAEQRQQKREEIKAQSQYVGEVGERRDFNLTLENRHEFESYYGYGTVYKFRDDEGNAVVWFSSSSLRVPEEGMPNETRAIEKGDRVRVKATVKNHKEYEGEKQTVVTRVKV